MLRCPAYDAFQQWLSRDDDTPLQVTRKSMFPILHILGLILLPLSASLSLAGGYLTPITFAAQMLTSCNSCAMLVYLCRTKRVTDAMIAETAFTALALFCTLDMTGVADSGLRSWPLIIVLVDYALLLCAPNYVVKAIVIAALAWLVVISFELQYRFGLLDVWGLPSQDDRHVSTCGCESLPCGNGKLTTVVNSLIGSGFVFLADFYFTSGFVRRIKGEVDVVEAAITTAQVIAANLVDFDLEAATANLDTARGRLPENLTNAFGDLIAHLEMYRPFLPDSLFEDAAAGASAPGLSGDMASAGYGGADVAIAFTDIRSSSTIWKANPEAMRLALRVHNKVIRRCIDTHDGYEVKTIGDAFMVAFWTVEDAVQFGLAVQEGLAAAHWPGELLQLPECLKVDGVWGGLAVRIGVAHGEATMERNDLTGRWDYFGTTVNLASRLEGVAVVGSVAGLGEQVTRALGGRVDERQVVYDGRAMLKGVSSGVGQEVLAIVPAGLTRRKWRPHGVHSRMASMSQVSGDVDLDVQVAVDVRRISSASSLDSCRGTVCSRGTGSSSERTPARGVPPLTHIKSATMGTMCLSFDDSSRDAASIGFMVNDLLQTMQSGLGRTSGTLVTVHGSIFSASWGVVRRGASHHAEALGFAFLMHEAVRTVSLHNLTDGDEGIGRREPSLSIGLCAGPLLSGSIGRGQQRFVTTLGRPVMGALRLGLLAQERGLPTLYGACSEAHSPATCGALEQNLVEAAEGVGECVVVFKAERSRADAEREDVGLYMPGRPRYKSRVVARFHTVLAMHTFVNRMRMALPVVSDAVETDGED